MIYLTTQLKRGPVKCVAVNRSGYCCVKQPYPVGSGGMIVCRELARHKGLKPAYPPDFCAERWGEGQ